ncbi:hypothetical protein CSA_023956, partial [Cucumis sativus]
STVGLCARRSRSSVVQPGWTTTSGERYSGDGTRRSDLGVMVVGGERNRVIRDGETACGWTWLRRRQRLRGGAGQRVTRRWAEGHVALGRGSHGARQKIEEKGEGRQSAVTGGWARRFWVRRTKGKR